MHKIMAKFQGRKAGAIGIFYPVCLTIEVAKADDETVRAACYESGYEHISGLRWFECGEDHGQGA